MALNHASHNPTGRATGPATGPPPPPSSESSRAIIDAARADTTGQSAPGADPRALKEEAGEGGEEKGGEEKGGEEKRQKAEKAEGAEGAEKTEGAETAEKEQKKQKTAKELAKERARAEKEAKFLAKQQKQQQHQQQQQQHQPKDHQDKVRHKDKGKDKKPAARMLPSYREQTPPGAKKLLAPLDDEYHTAYNPAVVESAWYDWWEQQRFHQPEFTADGEVKPAGAFVIAIPPPNVTGALHLGHALATALQDTLVRWSRMQGKTVLFLPGCDHAGLSTQSVVENMLYHRRNGTTRHDLGRRRFVETVWEWKAEYHTKINRTLKRLGASLDWSREAFTMDDNLSAAVLQTFIRLHDEGLIYRANRLVNWCTKLNTALSNLEVDQYELEGSTKIDVPGYDRKIEFGTIWNFKYPIDGTDDFIEVATTRPETMLGDSGVAVHPTDERYRHLIGKKARHPFVDRLLPIFGADDVEKDFGTGAVKITPAHDFNDFKRGQANHLEFINILNDDGTMNENAGPFAGHKRFDVRYEVIAELTKLGLYVGKHPNKMQIPRCSKSKDVIEPVMKPQWWMHMKPLAEPAIAAVKKGEIKILPAAVERDYYRWMENIDDWCLSRQLWWGHQIPAYYVKLKHGGAAFDSDPQYWICGETEHDARRRAEAKFPGREFELERDPDCLDTWFSSGLWPFSTLGWPNHTHDYEKLYPTSVLETGWDIIFFWVARMIMLGIKMTGKVPFTQVYNHGLIRDSDGRKMSKSLGNVIDPIDIMDGVSLETLTEKLKAGNLAPKEIERASKWQQKAFAGGIDECGADALRFTLINYATSGGDINFDVKVMRGYRNFCNKIYQATKFVLGNLPAHFTPRADGGKSGRESLPERWILHKLTTAARDTNHALEAREFSKATQAIYAYWYSDLCDVYIENSKAIIRDGTPEQKRSAIDTLYTALEGALTLIHPMMPFLTEELWQRLPRRPDDGTPSIVRAAYPQYEPSLDDAKSERDYELVLGCSRGLRSLLSENGIKENGVGVVQPLHAEAHQTAEEYRASIRALAKGIATLEIRSDVPDGYTVYPVSSAANVFLHLRQPDAAAEIAKQRPKLAKSADAVREQQKLISELAEGVSAEVKAKAEARLNDLFSEQRAYEESLARFEKMKLSDHA